MADQNDGNIIGLGKMNELLARYAHLTDRARRSFNGRRPHGLDGIDNHEADITGAFKGFTNICNIGFGGEFHGRLGELQTCRPHAQLGKGFLAGNINRAQLFARHACRGL